MIRSSLCIFIKSGITIEKLYIAHSIKEIPGKFFEFKINYNSLAIFYLLRSGLLMLNDPPNRVFKIIYY